MVTYVFDASAILRFLDNEAGAARVEDIIANFMDGDCQIVISAVNWGEIATKLFQKQGRQRFETTLADLQAFGFDIVDATPDRSIKSGMIKAQMKIPYADAFGVELTSSISESVLITADFDVKPAAHEIKIEFLPKK